jgi:hypothetical protein
MDVKPPSSPIVENRLLVFSLILLLIAGFGCGGGNPPAPPPPQAPEFIYVGNQRVAVSAVASQGTNSVSAFKLDTAGHLTELPHSPVALPLNPIKIVVDPKLRFLLIGGQIPPVPGGPFIYVPAAIGAAHDLTLVPNSQLPFGSALIDPLGRFLFEPDQIFTTTTPIHVYTAGGDLSFPEIASSPFFAGIFPAAIDPAGKFIFGIDTIVSGSTIDALQIASTGALSKISSVPASLFAQFAYVHPSGQFLYVQTLGPSSNVDLQVYKIDPTGSLTPAALTQNFVSPGTSLFLTAFSPSGKFVLATECSNACVVDTLSIDTVTGTINPTPTHSFPYTGAFTIDSTGSRLFQLSSGADCSVPGRLTVLNLDSNGRTSPTGITLPTGTCPDAVVVTQ